MQVKLSLPSKTFLLGEYLALLGGPALILNTAPRFELLVEEKSTDNNDLEIYQINANSPAGKFINQHADFFRQFILKFHDPYQGLGGFGASSAQYGLVVTLKHFYQKKNLNLKKILSEYQNLLRPQQGYTPSGADLVAQIYGGITYFYKNKNIIERLTWPFPQLCFALIHTGNKIATHTFIKDKQLKISEKIRKKIVLDGCLSLMKHDLLGFCASINTFEKTIHKAGLVAPWTLSLLSLIKKNSYVLAAKGCGAFGADVILTLFEKQHKQKFLNWANRKNLHVIIVDNNAQEGLAIQPQGNNYREEAVITVDTNDNQLGIEEKLTAHQNATLHRAFSVFIFRRKNNKNELLLQQRAQDKYHSGGLWTNTCCSHPQPGENVLQSAIKRLQKEMGIAVELFEVGTFRYKAKLNNKLVEHEMDHVFVGICADDTVHCNPQEVADYQWMTVEKLQKDLRQHPKKYTPWVSPALKLILKNKILDNLK